MCSRDGIVRKKRKKKLFKDWGVKNVVVIWIDIISRGQQDSQYNRGRMTFSVGVYVVSFLLSEVAETSAAFVGVNCNCGVEFGTAANSVLSDTEAISVIAEHHLGEHHMRAL